MLHTRRLGMAASNLLAQITELKVKIVEILENLENNVV